MYKSISILLAVTALIGGSHAAFEENKSVDAVWQNEVPIVGEYKANLKGGMTIDIVTEKIYEIIQQKYMKNINN